MKKKIVLLMVCIVCTFMIFSACDNNTGGSSGNQDEGLKGEEIPISGRIIALADTYDAMTSTRSYRQALAHETAIEEIKRCAGTQFDPVLAELFVKCSDEIKAAKEDPETYYPKYSYLQKQIYETR